MNRKVTSQTGKKEIKFINNKTPFLKAQHSLDAQYRESCLKLCWKLPSSWLVSVVPGSLLWDNRGELRSRRKQRILF